MTLREQILGAKPKLVPVECPAWGCTVYVDGTLPLADFLELQSLVSTGKDITIPVVILTARDADGSRLFTSDDAEELAQKHGITLVTIATVALKANGNTVQGTEAEVEAALGK